jgi:hypothetical protein
VKTHEAWGLGSYCFFLLNPKLRASRSFELPVTPGVKLRSVYTVSIMNKGTIERVVNNVGQPTNSQMVPVNVTSYP